MKSLLPLLAVGVLAGCTPFAKVSEIKVPPHGTVAKSADPLAALDEQLGLAENALRKLDADPADSAARTGYDAAVSRICGIIRERKLTPWAASVPVGSRTLVWQRDFPPVWNPALYELIPADRLAISGKYMKERETRAGLGAPLVAKRQADPLHDYAPTPHFFYAATAVARFDGSRCVLSLEDPLEKETVAVGKHTYPLAADFTAPLAMMLAEMEPEKLNIPRLLHPAEFAGTTRIARLEPYDPSKRVVLLVHGLASSPTTWFPLLNHLRADPMVRRHYQFWFFSYPSGYPYPYSAAILRRELDEAERVYPLHGRMVVVGHSMGGCISRLLVTDTKRQVWDQMFTVAPERMDVLPEHKHVITESAIFSSRPEIGRVIFISTPHRGSDLAKQWLGRVFTRLVKLPATLLSIGVDEARYLKYKEGGKHLARFPDSVDTLAPDNDFVRAINTVPIHPGIPYHTIAGHRGRGDSPNSSDGVVPYWSSHQKGARSELIVPSHHGAHQTTQAAVEVERILKENLENP